MTVSEAIIKWLKTFNPDEYQNMNRIDTDIQSAEVESYSLIKEPVQNVKKYLSGKQEITEHYAIMARLASQTNTDRIENNGFGESLTEWVNEQDKMRNYPDIGMKTQAISVTTPFYIGKTETNNSLYQMTIAIKYIKE